MKYRFLPFVSLRTEYAISLLLTKASGGIATLVVLGYYSQNAQALGGMLYMFLLCFVAKYVDPEAKLHKEFLIPYIGIIVLGICVIALTMQGKSPIFLFKICFCCLGCFGIIHSS